MNIFTNLKIGTKILIGFLIILTLMIAIGGIALVKISQIHDTVIDFADNLASDQHVADQLVSQILQVRLQANRYIWHQSTTDLKNFKAELANLDKLLAAANKELSDQEQSVVAHLKDGVQAYVNQFDEIIKLFDNRHKAITEVLNVQGPLAEEKLQQLQEKFAQANDASTLFYVSKFQRALLLMRLDAFKYLEAGDSQWAQKFEQRYQEAQVVFKQLDETLKDATLHQLAKDAETAMNLYYQSFVKLRTAYDQQIQLIEKLFYTIGPQLQEISSGISSRVSAEFAKGNQTTNLLVTQTWLQLLIVMSLAVLVGLGLSILLSRSITAPLVTVMAMTSQMMTGNLSQIVAVKNHRDSSNMTIRRDELGNLWRTFDAVASYFQTVIADVVRVSQGLAVGNLRITPTAEYRGDFIQIRQALETALSDLQQVIEDIVQVSQGLAEGQQIMPKAEYRGDFVQIKTGLETAATKLAEATTRNATQDWLKTGQALLNEQLRGEQDVTTLAKNIITFLTPYVEAQVGVFYLMEEASEGARESNYLKLIASYAYTQRKGLPTELPIGEGLVGQAALEQQFILVTDIPEDYIHIESGLGEAVPQNILVMPFLYENAVKGVIELGSFQIIRDLKIEFLKQVMSGIGIAVNTAESRTKMQALLQKVRG
jgi:methyl-accepting chemotaxis protein